MKRRTDTRQRSTPTRAEAGIREALQRSEDEKSAILSGLKGLVRVHYITPDYRIVWSNSDAAEEVGGEAGNDSPRYCYEAIQGRTKPCANCEVRDAFETGAIQDREESRLPDGRCFVVRTVPVRDDSGSFAGAVQVTLNITKFKEAEEGLKTTNEFLHSLLGNSPTPICVFGRDGRIDTVNRAWERIFGISRDEAVGHPLPDIFPGGIPTKADVLKEILASNLPVEMEESIPCPTGLRHFYTVKFPLQDAAGRPIAVGIIFVDVTEHRCAERELKAREMELERKSEELGEMNTALKVLLKQREEDQRELKERIVFNVQELVLPYLRKLKGLRLSDSQLSCLAIAETHLNDIVAPFLKQMVSDYPGMTARELQVATLVRQGKGNKEIAGIIGVSVNAIEIHRYNLRKKLGLQNRKANLRSYLLSRS
jgi:PAS domain S-box-containing protein